MYIISNHKTTINKNIEYYGEAMKMWASIIIEFAIVWFDVILFFLVLLKKKSRFSGNFKEKKKGGKLMWILFLYIYNVFLAWF